MSHEKSSNGLIQFLFGNSLFLISGTVIALTWANLDAAWGTHTHKAFFNYDLRALVGMAPEGHDEHAGDHEEHGATEHDESGAAGHDEPAAHSEPEAEGADQGEADASTSTPETASATPTETGADNAAGSTDSEVANAAPQTEAKEDHGGGHHGLSLYFIINDVLMAIFFGIAGKEVWESMLPGGALSNPRKAAVPLLATAGGVFGPALLYVAGVFMFSTWGELGKGWAIPCATDIAFSYLVARIVFGVGHPAIAFLLLLAIADDAAGLVILAAFYPDPNIPVQPLWLLLSAAGIGLGFVFRGMKLHSFWWYVLIPGVMSWYAFLQAGIHPALGLVPIIPVMPHAHTDLGIFATKELGRHDTLNEFEHFFKNPTEVILGLFGLSQAAVAFSAVDTGTWLVLAGLLLGKPVGITFLTLFADKVLKLQLPEGMSYRHVVTLGCAAGIGFTVALFVSSAAFRDPGPIQDSVKMGALGSFGAAIITIVVGRALGIRPHKPTDEEPVAESAAH